MKHKIRRKNTHSISSQVSKLLSRITNSCSAWFMKPYMVVVCGNPPKKCQCFRRRLNYSRSKQMQNVRLIAICITMAIVSLLIVPWTTVISVLDRIDYKALHVYDPERKIARNCPATLTHPWLVASDHRAGSSDTVIK